VKLSEHLDSGETECPCGCGLWRIEPALVETFEAIRTIVNIKRIGRGIKTRGVVIGKGGGIRCLQFQEILEKRGGYVSRYRNHCPLEQGNVARALDIHVPRGLTFAELQGIIKMLCGTGHGTGYYPARGFIHIDLGPERTWEQ